MRRVTREFGHRKYLPVALREQLRRRKDRHAELLILAAESRKWAARNGGGFGRRADFIATARAYLVKAIIERTTDRRRLP